MVTTYGAATALGLQWVRGKGSNYWCGARERKENRVRLARIDRPLRAALSLTEEDRIRKGRRIGRRKNREARKPQL